MNFRSRWKQAVYWLRALKVWLSETRHALTAILVVLVAIFVIKFSGSNEAVIRITGMVLQLLGILTVVWGIKETRELFGRPKIIFSLRQWLEEFPRYKGKTMTVSVEGHLGDISGSSSVHKSVKAASNASVEDRIGILERNIECIRKRLDEIEKETDNRFFGQSAALEKEGKTRESEVQEIRAKLEATETGGLHISAMGALWLFVGVILSSIPNELSRWFN